MKLYDLIAMQVPYDTLDPLCRSKIAATFCRQKYWPGNHLIVENQWIEQVGFICSGVADIYISNPDGSESACCSLGCGDYFGELSCLTDRVPLVRVTCREPIVAYTQSYDDFIRCLDTYYSLERFFLQSAMQKLRAIYHRPLDPSNLPTPPAIKRLPRPIAKAIRYMERNLSAPLDLEEVADIAGMSRYVFSRSFKRIMGYTFKEYLNKIRVHKAKRLISTGAMNVSEACFAAGFNDVAYFSRVFRKFAGSSPSKYKKTANVA